MKRLGERGGGNFLLLKIIVEGGGKNFLYVYYVIGNKEVFFWDVYKRQELYNSGLYAKHHLILFEFAAVIVYHRKKLPLIKKNSCR